MANNSRKLMRGTKRTAVVRVVPIGLVAAGLVGAMALPTMARAQTTSKATIVVTEATRAKLGKILVTAKGFTLYRDSADKPDHSTCTGGCATVWPPFVLPKGMKTATGSKGVTGLATIRISDRRLQVTYHKMPLYLFKSDTKAGEASGQGENGFFVVHPTATPSLAAPTTAAAGPTTAPTTGVPTTSGPTTTAPTTTASTAAPTTTPTTAPPTTAAPTTTPTTAPPTTTPTTGGSSWS